jgi:mannosyltransferase
VSPLQALASIHSRLRPRVRPPLVDVGIIGFVILVGFALRLYRLGDANVWWDEGYGVYLARKDLFTLAWETAGDVHPPVHYWLLHVWTRLVGESEFAIRFSSVIFGIASIALFYWLGRRTFGREVGLVAATLLATSRFHVEWSQQIRMYTLVTALAVVSIALTIQLWKQPTRRLWIGHIAVSTVGLYTLYLSGLVPLIESLATVVLCLVPLGGRRLPVGFLVRWVGAQLVSVALFVPWVILFLSMPRATPRVIYPIDLQTFLHASATSFPLGVSAYLDRYTPVTVAALAILALAVVVARQRQFQRTGLLLFLLVLAPPFIVFSLSMPNPILYAPNLSVRYLLIFLPAYHILLGTSLVFLWNLGRNAPLPPREARTSASRIERLPRWSGPGLAVVASLFLAGAIGWSLTTYFPERRLTDDYQTVVGFLDAHARPGDGVILNSDWDWPVYDYHAGSELPRYGVGTHAPITAEGATKLLAPLRDRHEGLWLLTSHNGYDSDPSGHVAAWLEENTRQVGQIEAEHRRLTLYSTDPTRSVATPSVVQPKRRSNARFDNGLAIIGQDVPVAEVAAGESLRFATYWQSPGPLPTSARASLRMLDDHGNIHRIVAIPVRDGVPLDQWPSGQVARTDYAIPIPRAMPPGWYQLSLGVIAEEREVPIIGSSKPSLGWVRIIGPSAPTVEIAPRHPLRVNLGDTILLRGYDVSLARPGGSDQGQVAPTTLETGSEVQLRLYWQARLAMEKSYTVFAQLVGPTNNPATGNPVWAQRDTYPVDGRHPTSVWVPGEVVIDEHILTVPADAPPGEYKILIGLYDLATGRRLPMSHDGVAAGDSIVVFEAQLTP